MKRSILVAALAVCSMLAAPVVSADGICLCGMKRPLVVPVPRPAVVAEGLTGCCRRPLVA